MHSNVTYEWKSFVFVRMLNNKKFYWIGKITELFPVANAHSDHFSICVSRFKSTAKFLRNLLHSLWPKSSSHIDHPLSRLSIHFWFLSNGHYLVYRFFFVFVPRKRRQIRAWSLYNNYRDILHVFRPDAKESSNDCAPHNWFWGLME